MKGKGAKILRRLELGKEQRMLKAALYQEELPILASNRTGTKHINGLSPYLQVTALGPALNHKVTTGTGGEKGVASALITQ